MIGKFPDDHVVELIRGLQRPAPSKIRRAMVKRTQWLQQRIADIGPQPDPTKGAYGFLMAELLAICVLMEMFDARVKVGPSLEFAMALVRDDDPVASDPDPYRFHTRIDGQEIRPANHGGVPMCSHAVCPSSVWTPQAGSGAYHCAVNKTICPREVCIPAIRLLTKET